MPRYPEDEIGYTFRCDNCDTVIPPFQGLYWISDRRERDGEVIDLPRCPECGAHEICAVQDH
jgi:uncharacterized C2H2 Zn-finger protein